MIEVLGSRKNVRILVVAVVAVGALVGGLLIVGPLQTNRNFDQAIEQVEVFIEKEDFSSALRELDQALSIKPGETSLVIEQKNRVKSLQASRESLAMAKKLLLESKYLEAMKALQSVDSEERGLMSEATALKNEIRPKIITNTKSSVDQLIATKKYGEAMALIETTNLQVGSPRILVTELSTIRRLRDAQIKAEGKAALAKLSGRYESFQDITWYNSPSTPKYRTANAFYLYFGMSDGEKLPLRLVIQYFDDDWLFIQSAKVNVDSEVYSMNLSDWERDNNSDIWEWSDEALEDRFLIEKIISSRSAVVRFDGRQYYNTRTISSTQKAALKSVLEAWDLQP